MAASSSTLPDCWHYFSSVNEVMRLCFSRRLSVCLSVSLFVKSVCLFVSLFVCLSVCQAVCLFVNLFVCFSVCQSVCQSVCLFVRLSVYLSVCQSVVCLFVCLLATSRKNYWWGLYENFTRNVSLDRRTLFGSHMIWILQPGPPWRRPPLSKCIRYVISYTCLIIIFLIFGQ